jgi:putative ABC transport system substrate-binding protein
MARNQRRREAIVSPGVAGKSCLKSRRTFLAAVATGICCWRLAVQAQQPATPVIGLLSSLRSSEWEGIATPFQQGLAEAGYSEGRNVAIEYRWAEGQYDRLPGLAADLVRRRVSAIVVISGTPAVLAAKAATSTIPIVFATGSDPLNHGLVANLGRPSGNVTGVTFFTAPLVTKRLEVLRELVPRTATIGVLLNPSNPESALEGTHLQAAAQNVGQNIRVFDATREGDIDRTFAGIVQEHIGALLVSADPLFLSQRSKVVGLAARTAVPVIYADREDVEAGGLISYGASRTEAYKQAGRYVGRILRGENLSDLPVIQPTRFELVINLRTAKALGLTIPPSLLDLADRVIQ